MIVLDHDQGSAEWHFARLGLPTSSEFDRILTPTLKPSKQAETTYLYDKLAEWAVGESQSADGGESPWMRRGTNMEAEARKWYEFEYGVTVEQVGLCLSDDGLIGCSPDGLVGEAGLVEIKNKSASHHIGSLLGADAHAHRCQTQGQLLVTGREWVDLVLYSPLMPVHTTRNEVDEEWRDAFKPELEKFLQRFEAAKDVLRAKGVRGKD